MIPIRYVTGDATRPIGEGTKIIAHVVNDVGAWGAGFTKALSARWPIVEKRYRTWHWDGYGFGLGRVDFASLYVFEGDEDIAVASMVAQHGLPTRENPTVIDYVALRRCLARVAERTKEIEFLQGAMPTVHMPRIGCGLAGGSWDKVEPLIVEKLCDAAIPVVVYDLPTGGQS